MKNKKKPKKLKRKNSLLNRYQIETIQSTVDKLGSRFLSNLTQIFKMCLALTEIFALMDVEVCWEPFSIFQLLSAFFVGMCEIGANEYELTADPASRINNVCHKSSFEFFSNSVSLLSKMKIGHRNVANCKCFTMAL